MAVVGEDAVYCAPEVDTGRADLLAGAAMGVASTAVDADVRISELPRAGSPGTWIAVVVLDADQHPIGTVDAGAIGPEDGTRSARDMARPIAPLRESLPLMMAVRRMVRERTRVLPVVDEHSSSVGVLTDLDALRWVAARAKAARDHGGG